MTVAFRYWFTWRWWFGYPDGVLVQLRCRLLGHSWTPCEDACCGGEQHWCGRCLSSRYPEIEEHCRV